MAQVQRAKTNGSNACEVAGFHWFDEGNRATRAIPPGGKAPRGAHVTAPHPNPKMRAMGWRIAFIFFGGVALFGCAAWYISYAEHILAGG